VCGGGGGGWEGYKSVVFEVLSAFVESIAKQRGQLLVVTPLKCDPCITLKRKQRAFARSVKKAYQRKQFRAHPTPWLQREYGHFCESIRTLNTDCRQDMKTPSDGGAYVCFIFPTVRRRNCCRRLGPLAFLQRCKLNKNGLVAINYFIPHSAAIYDCGHFGTLTKAVEYLHHTKTKV